MPNEEMSDLKIYRDSKKIIVNFTKDEKTMFLGVKRELLKNFDAPSHSIVMMINVLACEYIRYMRYLQDADQSHSAACVKSITSMMAELKLTPASANPGEVSNTLSQILTKLKTQ